MRTILLLALLAGPVAAGPLFFRDASVGLTFRVPTGWSPVRDAPGDGTYYQDPYGAGRLKVTVEECPLDDISMVPAAIETAMARGRMKASGKPELTVIGSYPCVQVSFEPPHRDGSAPSLLFVHYLVGRREIAFRLVGAGSAWPAARRALVDSLHSLSITGMPRHAPPGPVQGIPAHDAIVVAPPGFRPMAAGGGDTLARFVEPTSKQLFGVTWTRGPLLAPADVAEQFFTGLAEAGFHVGDRESSVQGAWPSVTAEATSVLDDTAVAVLFHLVFVHDRTFQVTATCRRAEASGCMPAVRRAARALTIGPPDDEGAVYRNPSYLGGVAPPRTVHVEVTALVHDAPETIPRATLALPLPRNHEPFQTVRIEGWSASPDDLVFDEWGNPTAAFHLTDVGSTARQRVVIRYACTVTPMTVRAADGGTATVSPRLEHGLTCSTETVPLGHPRVAAFATRALGRATGSGPAERLRRLLDAVAATAPSTAPSQPPGGTAWGRGALFALAHPDEAGPSERVDLFAALARDEGLPTRRCFGHLLPDEADGPPLPHAWCEVFLPPAGWIPCDPTPLVPGEPATMGVWSPRYLLLSHDGPTAVEATGPDAVTLWRGHTRGSLDRPAAAVEVARRVARP